MQYAAIGQLCCIYAASCSNMCILALLILENTKISLNYKNLCKREPPFTNYLVCSKYAANMLQNQILEEAHLSIRICHTKIPLYTHFPALCTICSVWLILAPTILYYQSLVIHPYLVTQYTIVTPVTIVEQK